MIKFSNRIKHFFRFKLKGFSLLEILIALAVMMVGIVGVMILFPVGLRASRMGETYTRSALLGQQIIEWLRTYSYSDIDAGTPTSYGAESVFMWDRYIYDLSSPYDNDLKEIAVTVKWKEGGVDRTENYYTYISRY